MLRHHIAVNPPAVGQTDKRAQPNFIDTGAPQPVRRFQPEDEILLLPFQVMSGIGRLMVGFLINHYAVQPKGFQFRIFLLRQRLHFHLQ